MLKKTLHRVLLYLVKNFKIVYCVAVLLGTSNNYWSSSEYSSNNARNVNTNNGNVNNNNKNNNNYVRAFAALPLSSLSFLTYISMMFLFLIVAINENLCYI